MYWEARLKTEPSSDPEVLVAKAVEKDNTVITV